MPCRLLTMLTCDAEAMRRPAIIRKAKWLGPLLALLLVIGRASADAEVADTQPYEINALRAQVYFHFSAFNRLTAMTAKRFSSDSTKTAAAEDHCLECRMDLSAMLLAYTQTPPAAALGLSYRPTWFSPQRTALGALAVQHKSQGSAHSSSRIHLCNLVCNLPLLFSVGEQSVSACRSFHSRQCGQHAAET